MRRGRLAALLTAVTVAGCSSTGATDPGTSASASRPGDAPATSARAGGPGRATPSPGPGRPPATVTVAAVGDVLPHAAVNRDAATGEGYDYDRMLAAVKPLIRRATIGICQLETALSADNTRLTRANAFNSPRELARTLRDVGFDGCSTANNHTWDAGLRGVRETREVLSDHGIAAAGPTPTASGSGAPVVYDAPIRVAHLSLSYSLMNSVEHDTTTPPAAAPWMRANLYAAQRASGIIASARRARAAGAEVVVVSLHWGGQFEDRITEDQRSIGDALLRSGAVDLVIGAHPHLVQPCAKVNGRYVLYSLGNFLSTQGSAVGSPQAAQDGVVATVRFDRDSAGRISQSLTYRPTWVDRGDRHRVEPATATQHADSYRRTVAAMSRDGCDAKVEP